MYQGQGYKTTTPIQLCNVLAALITGLISFKAVRVFFGCVELAAIREAAARSRKQGKSRGVLYRIEELEGLTGLSSATIKVQLAALETVGVLLFSETEISLTKTPLPFAQEMLRTATGTRSPKRAIPIPRSLICFLASCGQKATALTLIAYILRSLSLRRGQTEIKAAGTAKASWIAKTFGLSLRSVRTARSELLQLCVISEDNSTQRKLNRTGSYFVINTSWKRNKAEEGKAESQLSAESAPERTLQAPASSSNKRQVASPPQQQIHPIASPPYKYKETSFRSRNQKTRQSEQSGFLSKNSEKPNLKNITHEDLHRVGVLLVLFGQAVKVGWLADTEANKLKFLASAVRANAVGNDPVRVFVTIVRRELWHYITQAQEDRAAQALKKYRDKQEQRAVAKGSNSKQLNELFTKLNRSFFAVTGSC